MRKQVSFISIIATFIFLFSILCPPAAEGISGTPSPAYAGPTAVSGVVANSFSINIYEKFELTFNVTGSPATNLQFPYDLAPPVGIKAGAGISVDGLFSSDNWATSLTQPGFLFQD